MCEPALPALLTEVRQLLAQASHTAADLLAAARAQQSATAKFAQVSPPREADA